MKKTKEAEERFQSKLDSELGSIGMETQSKADQVEKERPSTLELKEGGETDDPEIAKEQPKDSYGVKETEMIILEDGQASKRELAEP